MSDVAVGVESGVRVEVIVRVRVIYTASGLESDPEESVPVSKLTFEEEHFLRILLTARLPPSPPPTPLAIVTKANSRANQNVGLLTPQIVFSFPAYPPGGPPIFSGGCP